MQHHHHSREQLDLHSINFFIFPLRAPASANEWPRRARTRLFSPGYRARDQRVPLCSCCCCLAGRVRYYTLLYPSSSSLHLFFLLLVMILSWAIIGYRLCVCIRSLRFLPCSPGPKRRFIEKLVLLSFLAVGKSVVKY